VNISSVAGPVVPSHNRPEIRDSIEKRFAGVERLEDHDIAAAIGFIVTRPRRVTVNEILIRPTDQEQ
jgi:NADP-dependent 3-hydroxy acid dehydrogenase YdfG